MTLRSSVFGPAVACAVMALRLLCTHVGAQQSMADEIEAGFRSPPPSARPWVFWFWLDGNITSDGITADLEAMARVGLGGAIIMDVSQGIPPGPVKFFDDQWRNLFRHAVSEAARLNL